MLGWSSCGTCGDVRLLPVRVCIRSRAGEGYGCCVEMGRAWLVSLDWFGFCGVSPGVFRAAITSMRMREISCSRLLYEFPSRESVMMWSIS